MIDQIAQTTGAAGPAGSVAPQTNMANANQAMLDSAEISSDFQTFLKMMTVQVRNQDPLNPVDASDYATQLATFAGVEQQVKTNELLTAVAGQIGGGLLQQVSGWIGKEALARAPVQFDQSGPISLRPEYATGADSAELVVRDAQGLEIERLPLTPGQREFEWTGNDPSGVAYPPGVYQFEVESFADDELVDARTAAVYNRIDEVRTDGNVVVVRLSDGTEVPASLVSSLRNPD